MGDKEKFAKLPHDPRGLAYDDFMAVHDRLCGTPVDRTAVHRKGMYGRAHTVAARFAVRSTDLEQDEAGRRLIPREQIEDLVSRLDGNENLRILVIGEVVKTALNDVLLLTEPADP